VSDAELWGMVVVLAGAGATLIWRALGVALSGRIKPDSPVLELVSCIAYALLASLVARMILLPIGPLQAVGLSTRLIAAGVAVGVFYALGRSLLAGVVAGGGALALLAGGFAVFW
jgi:branched-subunit amino acid transport protein